MHRFPATIELVCGPPPGASDEIDVAWERARESLGSGPVLHVVVRCGAG